MFKKFPNFIQSESKDCGPTCLRIIAKHYGKSVDINNLRQWSETTRDGSNLAGMYTAAENIGFRPIAVQTNIYTIIEDNLLPSIAHWQGVHFVVVYKISPKWVYVSDPAIGLLKYSYKEFVEKWVNDEYADPETAEGILLLLNPTSKLYEDNHLNENDEVVKNSDIQTFSSFLFYISLHKSLLLQLFWGLFSGVAIAAIIPFLTQSVVDLGIQNQNIDFIYLVFASQLLLHIGSLAIEVIRGWILLHLNTRINVSLISDFFFKLMSLPIAYFDITKTGDILQRISDHERIKKLLTSDSLDILFSLVNLLVFAVILGIYNTFILLVFLTGSLFYLAWILIFLKKRKLIDYEKFAIYSQDNSKIIELISGMQEIKLHNAERKKRWGWERIQAKLFKANIKGLRLTQIQGTGSNFINQIKNLFISFLSAKLVIDGEITLGMMLAISYIIGQLDSPIKLLIGFINTFQDAKISLERINEIYGIDNENQHATSKLINSNNNLILKNVHFRYPGTQKSVLRGVDLEIPCNKTTAIVGISGSGKTTLMKMLLKIYAPTEGEIFIGKQPLANILHSEWRNSCGAVMQEGFLFNDTLANNIAIGEDYIDVEQLRKALEVANLMDYVETLPKGWDTQIGTEGINMSTGQKQRLLIARAVYKNPQYIFFDEATSALDATNEKVIIENLSDFFKNRTSIIIAHRLSTVKNADQIVVLDEGIVKEIGTHSDLVKKKGIYFQLVKNQLELGN